MTLDEAIEAVEAAAAALSLAVPDVSSGKGKAFEAWALLSIARHLRDDGHGVDAVGCDDEPVTVLVVRGGPGNMPPASADPATSPSHLVVSGGPYLTDCELHLGLMHAAPGGPRHELDLSVIPRSAGWRCRATGGGPYTGHVMLAAELKAYDAKHRLGHVFARALLGTMVDLQPWRGVQGVRLQLRVQSGEEDMIDMGYPWWPREERSSMYLCTTTGIHEGSKRLLARHGGDHLEGLDPSTDWPRFRPIARDIADW